jgi:hypothetical protein
MLIAAANGTANKEVQRYFKRRGVNPQVILMALTGVPREQWLEMPSHWAHYPDTDGTAPTCWLRDDDDGMTTPSDPDPLLVPCEEEVRSAARRARKGWSAKRVRYPDTNYISDFSFLGQGCEVIDNGIPSRDKAEVMNDYPAGAVVFNERYVYAGGVPALSHIDPARTLTKEAIERDIARRVQSRRGLEELHAPVTSTRAALIIAETGLDRGNLFALAHVDMIAFPKPVPLLMEVARGTEMSYPVNREKRHFPRYADLAEGFRVSA